MIGINARLEGKRVNIKSLAKWPRAEINTAKVEAGAKCIVFGLGGIGLNVIQGLRLVGAAMIIGVDVNPEKKAWGERFGMTHFVNAAEVGSELVPHLVNMTKSGADQIGGADYTFECIGNVNLMRAAPAAGDRALSSVLPAPGRKFPRVLSSW